MSCTLHTERHIRHSVQLALPREASSIKASTPSNFATFHAQVHSDDNNTRSTKPLECGHLHCLETRQDNHTTLSIATASNLPPRCLHNRCVGRAGLALFLELCRVTAGTHSQPRCTIMMHYSAMMAQSPRNHHQPAGTAPDE